MRRSADTEFRRAWKLLVGASLAVMVASSQARPITSTNMEMIRLARCVVPIGWATAVDRATQHNPFQVRPSSDCLNTVQRNSVGSTRTSMRLALIEGDIASYEKQYRLAVVHYRRAARLANRPVPGIWGAVASIQLWQLKEYSAALATVTQALRSAPEDEGLRKTGGMLYLYYIPPYSNYRQALAVMRPELGFTGAHFYNIAAGSYIGIGRYGDAILMAQAAVRLSQARDDANLTLGLYHLGIAQHCTGQPEEGRRSLAAALALSPLNSLVKAALEDAGPVCKQPATQE